MELSNMEIWAIIGVVLLITEIFAVSFFFMFFGVGALVTSLTIFLDITPDLISQLVVFVAVTVVSTLLFRKQLREGLSRSGDNYEEMIEEHALVTETIEENSAGRVFFRGASWMAVTSNGSTIAKDAKVVIKKVDGIKLIVEAI